MIAVHIKLINERTITKKVKPRVFTYFRCTILVDQVQTYHIVPYSIIYYNIMFKIMEHYKQLSHKLGVQIA